MKVGIDTTKLITYKDWMVPLVRLDPRGGLFSQVHMQLAVEQALTSLNMKAEFQAGWLETEDPKSIDEHIILCAFTTRVVLSHLRLVFDSCQQKDGHPLEAVFEILTQDVQTEVPTMKRQKRADRLHKRPNPFMCFKGSEDDPKTRRPTSWM